MADAKCPQCGRPGDDPAGLGIQYCPNCGYCTHAIEANDGKGNFTCRMCGRIRKAEAQGGRPMTLLHSTKAQQDELKEVLSDAVTEFCEKHTIPMRGPEARLILELELAVDKATRAPE